MRFMTIDNVAENLAVKRRTVERLIKSGQLQAIKVNSMIRISEESYKIFINHNAIKNVDQNQSSDKHSTFDSLMKHFGSCSNAKDDYEEILNYIKENRTEAEF
jgi:excisionase family DNA binding protein